MLRIIFEGSIFLHQKYGGISKYICSINERLSKFNKKSLIYSPISINQFLKKKTNQIFYLQCEEIPNYCRTLFFWINDFFTLFYIFLNKPDILHLSYYNNNLVKFIKIPYIITVYDLIHERIRNVQSQFDKKELINKAAHIICISNQTKKDLIKYYNVKSKKISVVYLGIEKRIRRIKNKKKYILYVGSRNKYKNFRNLAQAFGKSNFLKKNFKIICFGGGNFNDEEKKLFKKINIQKKVIFKHGDEKKLNQFYSNASLYVSVSLFEGFGLTPLEAMRCGCPVICSNISIFKEILGKSCIFVDPQNPKQIKSKIENILKSKKQQNLFINRGYFRIKKFDWNSCAKKTAKIYEKITLK